MIELSAKNISKSYGVQTIIDGVSFNVQRGDRIGIVGPNGAGKTTLMNIIAGELEADNGEIFKRSELGYLSQNTSLDLDKTVYESASCIYDELIREGKSDVYESMISGTLKSMAFPESYFDKKVATLSGGEKTRLALALLLLRKPDILLLDEPTNHLDLGTLAWLESYLKSYKGTILVVSHDRYFLDEVVSIVFDVENHTLTAYKGNYSEYAEKKRIERENALALYEKQQAEIGRQEEIIRRFKQHGTEKLAKRAQSREKRLSHIEAIERPEEVKRNLNIHFKQKFKSGTDVLFAEDLSKSYGDKLLFKDVSFDIKKSERIAMVGANGIGKTTLLKIIDGEVEPDKGELKLGHNVKIAYYDQEQESLNPDNTLLDELSDSYRLYSDTEMRKILGRFMFTGDTVFQKIGSLSGGEKARLSLLKLMLSGSNTLLLDEPTNHLDIDSKEMFEDALLDYPGTVIAISHDRYFLKKIPTRIVELEREGLVNYLGSYDYYTEKKSSSKSDYLKKLRGGDARKDGVTDAAEERRIKKQAETERKRREKLIEELESKIEQLEAKASEIEATMCREDILQDHEKLSTLSDELKITKEIIEKTYEEWHNSH